MCAYSHLTGRATKTMATRTADLHTVSSRFRAPKGIVTVIIRIVKSEHEWMPSAVPFW